MSGEKMLSLTFEELLRRTSARTPDAGAGAVSALTCASAAALTAMVARFAGPFSEPILDELEAMALELGELADLDGDGFGELLAAWRLPTEDPHRGSQIAAGALRACEVPLRVCELGARVVDHAARLVINGKPDLQGDALTAAYLGDACVRSAARLVRLNAKNLTGQEPVHRADGYAQHTARVVSRLDDR